MAQNKLLLLKPSHLLPHPKNMRRFYTKDQVEEMANSIRASKGVLEPLIVVKEPKGTRYLVVDGNMRLQGAKHLGDECPPLECKEITADESQQALVMATANGVRYDVDPVSEALHYKSMKDQGLSVRDISKRTGIYEARITNRLALAELQPEVQQLIVNNKLPVSKESAHALGRLAPAQQVKMAMRLSENPNTKVVTIIKACEALAAADGGKKPGRKRPAVELSGALAKEDGTTKGLREAAQKMCHRCNQFEAIEGQALEPAWSMMIHAADDTCNTCPMKEVQSVCGNCPAVDLLRRLVTGKVKYAR